MKPTEKMEAEFENVMAEKKADKGEGEAEKKAGREGHEEWYKRENGLPKRDRGQPR